MSAGPPSPDLAKVNPELVNAAALDTLKQGELFVAQASPDSLDRQLIERAHKMKQNLNTENWLDKMKYGGEIIIDTDAQIQAQIEQIKDPQLKAEAQQKYDNAKKLANEGNSTLQNADYRKTLMARINRDPKLREQYDWLKSQNLSDEQILDKMLDDPELGQNLAQELSKTPQQHKLDEERFQQAERQQKAAQERRDAADRTLKREKAKLEAQKAKRNEYNPNKKNSKGETLHELEQREATLKGDQATATETISNADSNLKRLRDERTRIERDLREYRGHKGYEKSIESMDQQLRDTNQEIERYERDRLDAITTKKDSDTELGRLDDLRSERNVLDTDIQTTTDNITKFEDDLRDAERALKDENEYFELVKRLRTADEQSFVHSFDHAVSRAVDRTVQEQSARNHRQYLEARDAQQQKMIEDAKQTEDTRRRQELEQRAQDDATITDAVFLRYYRGDVKKLLADQKWAADHPTLAKLFKGDDGMIRGRIAEDYELLFTDPDNAGNELLRRVLGDARFGTLDRAARDRLRPIVVREVISTHRGQYGPETPIHEAYMRHTQWYREMVADGIRFNPQVRQEVQTRLGNKIPLTDENGNPTDTAVQTGMNSMMALSVLMGLGQTANQLTNSLTAENTPREARTP